MGRLIGKALKWILVGIVLVILGLIAPIAYVETSCHAPVAASTSEPLLRDPSDRRPEANTYLTYPEWHIVYAYDGLAEVLKTSDEYDFDYMSSVWQFWSATCTLTRVADGHGGADGDTRLMIHTIGASFTLEMALKAGYEETVGSIFAAIRGPVKTPQDEVAAAMATGYATFLRQTPWYRYDFDNEVLMLWAAPVTDTVRGWERRLALGGEWKAKAAYAQVIKAGVAATGVAKLSIRSVVQGVDETVLAGITDVTIVSTGGDGTVIETPRYARFTQILSQIAREGGTIREIAGNDDIMVSVTVPPGDDYVGPGEVVTRLSREGFWSERVLVDTKVTDLARLIAAHPPGDPGLEHVFDY